MSQVVLGGGGAVGRETIAALAARGLAVTSVTRSGTPAEGVIALAADLTQPEAVRRAVAGAEVAYLTVGLPYSISAWRRDWPVILDAVVAGCIDEGVTLVYFDNVYAYGPVAGEMTETSPIAPSSKKGALRAGLLNTLSAATRGGLDLVIARSADFYGPGAATSVFNRFVIDRVAAGKAPSWPFDKRFRHSLSYTPDIGRALAVLGTDPRAVGRVWHVPTAPALTGEEYMLLATSGKSSGKTMSRLTFQLGGVFVGEARESLEMAYQYTAPYLFDSTAFETTFGIHATPYAEAIAASLAAARLAG